MFSPFLCTEPTPTGSSNRKSIPPLPHLFRARHSCRLRRQGAKWPAGRAGAAGQGPPCTRPLACSSCTGAVGSLGPSIPFNVKPGEREKVAGGAEVREEVGGAKVMEEVGGGGSRGLSRSSCGSGRSRSLWKSSCGSDDVVARVNFLLQCGDTSPLPPPRRSPRTQKLRPPRADCRSPPRTVDGASSASGGQAG